jgi:hypothetical protein
MPASSKPARAESSRKKPPWRKSAPKSSRHSKLSKGQKAKAKAAAKRAGRPYPNLVDNMRVASSTKRSRSGTEPAKGGARRRARAKRKS